MLLEMNVISTESIPPQTCKHTHTHTHVNFYGPIESHCETKHYFGDTQNIPK